MVIQEHAEELAILEALDVGKPVTVARAVDVATVCTAVGTSCMLRHGLSIQ